MIQLVQPLLDGFNKLQGFIRLLESAKTEATAHDRQRYDLIIREFNTHFEKLSEAKRHCEAFTNYSKEDQSELIQLLGPIVAQSSRFLNDLEQKLEKTDHANLHRDVLNS